MLQSKCKSGPSETLFREKVYTQNLHNSKKKSKKKF